MPEKKNYFAVFWNIWNTEFETKNIVESLFCYTIKCYISSKISHLYKKDDFVLFAAISIIIPLVDVSTLSLVKNREKVSRPTEV